MTTDNRVTTIPIRSIRLDFQPPERICQETVKKYAIILCDGKKFPPVEVCWDGVNYWLADGFHRLTAAKLADLQEVEAVVLRGTFDDLQWGRV